MSHFTVFACESQPIVIEGLAKVLAGQNELEYVGGVQTQSEALAAVRELQPDIMMVDHTAGLKMVFQFVSDIRNICPNCQPVLWVSDLAEIDCYRALQIGARGVLKKTLPVESVIECLRSVGQGNIWIEGSVDPALGSLERRSAPRLTPREREIVVQVCAGLKNKEIAHELSITAGTVKVHLMHIFEKTGVKDRFELAIHGRRLLGTEQSDGLNRMEAAR